MSRALLTVILCVTAGFTLAACDSGGSGGSGTPVELSEGDTIEVGDDFFDPAHAVVASGTTVTWEWTGNVDHNVVGDDFSSDVIDSGSFDHTFDEPGTYEYTCTLHGNMDGVIEVTD